MPEHEPPSVGHPGGVLVAWACTRHTSHPAAVNVDEVNPLRLLEPEQAARHRLYARSVRKRPSNSIDDHYGQSGRAAEESALQRLPEDLA